MDAVADAQRRAEVLGAYLDAWEAEHGAFTPEELATAERELRLSDSRSSRDLM